MTERKVNVDDLNRHLRSAGLTFSLTKKQGGVSDGNGKDHSQACPFCQEGKNRFWFSVEYDRFFCRKCKPRGGYSIYDVIMHHQGIGFREVLELVARESCFIPIGVSHVLESAAALRKMVEERKPILTLGTYRLDEDSPTFKEVQKHRPEISFADYQRAGAKLCHSGVVIPMFSNDGVLSGYVQYMTDSSKKTALGSKSGIVGADAIYNLRTAKQVKIVFKTAGVSDYLILSGLIARLGLEADYYCFTNGCGENELPDKFEPLLRPALTGLSVGVVQDNDEAGATGALRWAESIAEYASNVQIIRLPKTVFDCTVKDLRDFLSIDGTTFTDVLFQ